MKFFLVFLVALNAVAATPFRRQAPSSPFPDPVPCKGTDCSAVHDPSVVRRDDGTYWRFSTFENIHIAKSPSMFGPWEHQGSVLNSGSLINIPNNDGIWAPDVYNVGGTFYLYYAVSKTGTNQSDIGLATSPTLESGSWIDHGSIGVPPSPSYNRIDPNLLFDLQSKTYKLTFGSFNGDIFQVDMANPPQKLASGARHLESNATSGTEGSYQFQWFVDNKLYYYLFFSSGACCAKASPQDSPTLAPLGSEYKVMACRSESSTGPFVDDLGRDCETASGGKLVLGSHGANVYAPGGQGLMWSDEVKSVIMYYHYVNPTIGYKIANFQFGWNKVDFSSGWPVLKS